MPTQENLNQIINSFDDALRLDNPAWNTTKNFLNNTKIKLTDLQKDCNEEEKKSRIAWAIPLERLYVIRSNMKEFLDKWGREPENKHLFSSSKEFYEKCRKVSHKWLGRPEIKSEVGNLMNPNKRVRFSSAVSQWGGRFGIAVSGVLALTNGDPDLGVMAVSVYLPFEVVASSMKKYFDFKKEEWGEFKKDSKDLWNNYDELVGIIRSIRSPSLGEVNEEIKYLEEKIFAFIEEYDKDDNKIIDLEESEIAKKDLTCSLREKWDDEGENKGKKKKLEEIIQAIRKLEKGIINYRQGIFNQASEITTEIEKEESTQQSNRVGISNSSNNKGKNKKTNDNQSELQAVIIDKTHDYGSINNK